MTTVETPTLSLDGLIEQVREVVKEQPKLQYWGEKTPIGKIPQTCEYVNDDDEYECLMAQAMGYYGVDKKFLKDHNNISISSVLEILMELDLDKISTFDRIKLDWLERVQGYQDKNHPWGACVRIVDAEHEVKKYSWLEDE